MPTPRTIAWMLAIAFGITAIASGLLMASRIARFHKENPREVFAFQRIDYTDFEFQGRHIALATEVQDGISYLRVQYGDESLRLLATIPGEAQLPGLLPHEKWMRILMFASAVGKTINQVHADLTASPPRLQPRMVIVTRTPPPGQPAAYEGRLNPKAWYFDFYEFKAEGGFDHQRLHFPTTKPYQPDKQGELRENTWEYQAALSVIPGGIAPKPKFTNDGLKAAGWTLPAATAGTLAMLAAITAASVLGKKRAVISEQ